MVEQCCMRRVRGAHHRLCQGVIVGARPSRPVRVVVAQDDKGRVRPPHTRKRPIQVDLDRIPNPLTNDPDRNELIAGRQEQKPSALALERQALRREVSVHRVRAGDRADAPSFGLRNLAAIRQGRPLGRSARTAAHDCRGYRRPADPASLWLGAMPKVTLPISVEVSEDTAAAIQKGSQAVETVVGLLRSARDMRLGEQVIDTIAAARRATTRRKRR